MDNLRSVLEYIRSFFGAPVLETSRKRRGSEIDSCISPKYKRSMTSSVDPFRRGIHATSDEWFGKVDSLFKKSLLPKPVRKPLKIVDTITLNDDEDDVVLIKSPNERTLPGRPRINHTSTPAENRKKHFVNGNGVANGVEEDVTFVKEIKSPKEKKEEAKLAGFNYIKPYTGKYCNKLFDIGVADHNGVKLKTDKKSACNNNRSKVRCPDTNSLLDESYRIDDKMQYKKLLAAASSNSVDSIYYTPVGKLFEYDMASKDRKGSGKSPLFDSRTKSKETTKDCIIKVLDNHSSEHISIKDSDSDDVIFVSPPSPKPDIIVDPVNSFKKIVDSSMFSKRDWLDGVIERHKHNVKEREREINTLRESSHKHRQINKDINQELLKNQIERCLHIKDIVLPVVEREEETVFPELNEEQMCLVTKAFKGDPNEVLIHKFNLTITRRDLMTLHSLNWLNDEVINFYMNLIIQRGLDPKWPRAYAFNTFFFPKLMRDGPQSLRRWTKKVDLFSYDLVCFPIHLGMHWCMAIVDFRSRTISYYDSMGSSNDRCLQALRNYLEAEHLDKKKCEFDTTNFTLINREDIPQQMNGSDCGMFSCTFAEFITRNAKITFSQEDMPYLRKKMVVEILSGELLIK
ncbi:uncharacterized protein LOC132697273 [Cylas formicarius]|uniref:uncharacterized protein LOC132697273 n=1 Tax=Cylas formicarius TaxID=197179 RepID=UPI00295837AB|nr:uncharacterized protein LOC132697273 [Cylas formicarius]